METQNTQITIDTFNKTNVSKALLALIDTNSDLFGSNVKREKFKSLISELVTPQRVRNDNPYIYAEDGVTVTDIMCNKYNQYLPVDHFPTPTEGKYKTTSKVASWKYNEFEKQIKAVEAETMTKIFAGEDVDTVAVKQQIDKLKELQKTDYVDYTTDYTAWENREGKRK